MEVQLQNHCFKTDLYKSQLGMNYYFFETAHGDGAVRVPLPQGHGDFLN